MKYFDRTHQVLSNTGLGYGRYDVMVITRDINKIAIIIKLKNMMKKMRDIRGIELRG